MSDAMTQAQVGLEMLERLESYLARQSHCTCREPLPCRRYCGHDLCALCQRIIRSRRA